MAEKEAQLMKDREAADENYRKQLAAAAELHREEAEDLSRRRKEEEERWRQQRLELEEDAKMTFFTLSTFFSLLLLP